MKIKGILLFVGMLFLMNSLTAVAEDAGAYGQLNDAYNTGVTFDGSDGQRSGMDTGIDNTSGGIPEVPEPTPVDAPAYSEEPTTYNEPAPVPEPEPAPVVEPEPEPAPAPEPAPEPVEEQGPPAGEEVA